jgi:hypothetical protein
MLRAVAVTLSLTALTTLIPVASMGGEEISVKDLPAAVVNAIQARFPGTELLRAERERDDGKIEYEVKFRHQGVRWEAEVTEDGRIKEVERDH